MKVAVGADHRGCQLKNHLKMRLESEGIEVIDFGTKGDQSVDYPDHGRPVAEAVADGDAEWGITVCSTGTGMNITTNKTPGVRSVLALNPEMATLGRQHNNGNVLSLAAKYTSNDEAWEIVQAWRDASFDGGRHTARVAKIEPATTSAGK